MQGTPATGDAGRAAAGYAVALVHDYLTQFGGAERVLVALHELFPNAPVHTSLVDPAALPPEVRAWDIRACLPPRLGVAAKRHQLLLPLYPAAFARLEIGPEEADVVLADSSAWTHHVRVRGGTALVCYCHSPARFLYGDRHYLGPAGLAAVAGAPLFAPLRRVDRHAAARVDRYLANSEAVAARIRRVYGRDAAVVYPPVDVERFHTGPDPAPEPWFLAVSRLVPHKRIDLVVETCSRLGLPLKVIGTGRSLEALRRRAGPTVEFLGYQPDRVVADHLRRCRAFILPAAEDFGITAVEAQAAGRPVIAFGEGGALESVVAWQTGVFFAEQTVETLAAAIAAFERRTWDPRAAREHAARFNRRRFQAEIRREVEAALAAKRAARTFAGAPLTAPAAD